jgi:hypothetical protein
VKQNKNKYIITTSMKKITSLLLLCLAGYFGIINKAHAQSNATPVPIYEKQIDIPNTLTPQQKLLLSLPFVESTENSFDFKKFTIDMENWIKANVITIEKLDSASKDLISNKKFEELANVLIKMGHFKEISSNKNKGGKHE